MGRKELVWFLVAGLATVAGGVSAAEAQTRRVQLRVLVLSAADTGTEAVMAGLDEALVPYTEVDLTDTARPTIDAGFLSDRPSWNVRRAKFQAVVMPNEAPPGLSEAELDALHAYEREYGIRQLDAYIYPQPALGLNWPADPGYIGPLDGFDGQVTAAGLEAGFGHLAGPVPFDDISPVVDESYGYLATPLAAPPAGTSFTTLVDAPIPGTSARGVLVGVFDDNGREEMVVTAAMNAYQLQQQLLIGGILEWLTYGVHLGYQRNYLSVHIDDVFLSDTRWVTAANCTAGDDCPPEITAPEILMTTEDVDYLLDWQQAQGIKLDMVFNGAGHDEALATNGSYPLGERLLQNRNALRWVNHTYTHLNVGCVKDISVSPWRCATDEAGNVVWQPYEVVYDEIALNIDFARQYGIPFDRDELVTGEHSGLRRVPEEPSDNPNLVRAVNALSIDWLGSDNSREWDVRSVGNGRTVPRYPMSIYYNVGTFEEEIDEYNWIYNSRADGGSGLCEDNPLSTCIPPLDPATGFWDYLLPLEARATLLHMLGNSPKPHYAHQSNLAEDRILYPVLDETLAQYRSLFADTTPVVNPSLTESGNSLVRQDTWASEQSTVNAYVQSGRLYVRHSAGTFRRVQIPVTLPVEEESETDDSGSGGLFGWLFGWLEPEDESVPDYFETYGAGQSGWESVIGYESKQYELPDSVGYPR